MLSKQAFYHIDGEEFVLPINPSNLIGITYCLRELEDKLNKLKEKYNIVDCFCRDYPMDKFVNVVN